MIVSLQLTPWFLMKLVPFLIFRLMPLLFIKLLSAMPRFICNAPIMIFRGMLYYNLVEPITSYNQSRWQGDHIYFNSNGWEFSRYSFSLADHSVECHWLHLLKGKIQKSIVHVMWFYFSNLVRPITWASDCVAHGNVTLGRHLAKL